MGILLEKLDEKKILISDGAWGTMLQARGMAAGDCPEQWNVSHAEDVKSVAADYAAAGSDVILTNTFGGSSLKLEKFGLIDKVSQFNLAGAENSISGAPDSIIAGSVGPTGQFIEPLGDITSEQMEKVFTEQISAILAAGVKVICIETMQALEECGCAIRAVKNIDPTVDVMCTMTFDKTPAGFRTMMGTSPTDAAEKLIAYGADVIGSNCGNGIENMVEITAEFRANTDAPILIHANAGLPELVDGKTVFRQSPQDMAVFVPALIQAGANIIGGCCGTTPEHIIAMKKAI